MLEMEDCLLNYELSRWFVTFCQILVLRGGCDGREGQADSGCYLHSFESFDNHG